MQGLNKKDGVYFGEDKSKPKKGILLAHSAECKNKNLEIGKEVILNKYEMIPSDNENEYFVSEKALIAII